VAESITQVELPFAGRRTIRAVFDEAPISSDGGAPLLREIDAQLGLTQALADVVGDTRDPRYVTHSRVEQIRQRVFGIALGYEDCNDAQTLRHDAALKVSCGIDDRDRALSSQPSLSRLETSVGPKTCYRLAQALLDSYFVRHPVAPKRLIVDTDTTFDPTHGQQQLAFFNAFYDGYGYQPLLFFDGDGDLLTAILLPGKSLSNEKLASIVRRVLERIRQRWPDVELLLRGDSHFTGGPMLTLCRELDVRFVLGLAPNKVLHRKAEAIARRAHRKFERTGEKARLFTTTRYRARFARPPWPRSYRVIIKAEHMAQGSNTRFVVTDLPDGAEQLYGRYVERGESCENSIKDLKNVLRADRLSCHRFWANQFRLLLHSAAYVLMFGLRRAAAGTELAQAQMDTLRLRLLKVAARVESTVRHVWFHLTSAHPWQQLWRPIAQRLARPGWLLRRWSA
jgi:hypothetical protein